MASFSSLANSKAGRTAWAATQCSSRTDNVLRCRRLPLMTACIFPLGVRGPVERSQGRFRRAACRSRSRAAEDSGLRFCRFCRPAICRGVSCNESCIVLTGLVTNQFGV